MVRFAYFNFQKKKNTHNTDLEQKPPERISVCRYAVPLTVDMVKFLREYIFQIYERLHFCRLVIQKISVAVHGVLQSTEVSEDWLAFRCVGYVLLKSAQYSRKANAKDFTNTPKPRQTVHLFVSKHTPSLINQQPPNFKNKKCPKH